MKITKTIHKHEQFPLASGYNLLAITHEGNYMNAQVFSEDYRDGEEVRTTAAKRVLEWIEKGLDENNDWNSPIVRVFINCHSKGNETYEYDLLDMGDLVLLGLAAGKWFSLSALSGAQQAAITP